MRRLFAAIPLLVLALPAGAQEEAPVSALLEHPEAYDQAVVRIVGEIVGDYGDRGDVVWVQVNDDAYVERPLRMREGPAGTNTGIAVRYPSTLHADFGPPGGYRVRGPIVEVTGIFRDLDPGTGGLTFVDATEIRLLERAMEFEREEPDVTALVVGGVLLLLGLGALAQRRDLIPGLSR